jgi:DNA repair exonuclease SbcCD ATPase subunit
MLLITSLAGLGSGSTAIAETRQSESAHSAPAASPDANTVPASESTSALVERSLEGAAKLWQQSSDSASDFWQRSRDATLGVWEDAQQSLQPADPAEQTQIWKDLIPKLDDALSLEDQIPALPQRSWLGRDQRDAEADINELLDAAVGILSRSPVQHYRTEIAELRGQIRQARAEIDRFRRERVAAPEESLVQTTRADYEERIAAKEADIRAYLAELDRIKTDFARDLRAMGLQLDDKQIDLLLATVVGDNVIDLGILFDNVQAITTQLEGLVEESGEDLDSARRYYGMYVILLRALEHMHDKVITAINERYLPHIDAIAERAATLSDETRALLRSQPERANILRSNLDAQQLTIEAADVYRDYLAEQRAQVEQARSALNADIDTAWNTYQTVQVSGELVDLVQSSRSLLDSLLDREVPPLRPFQNLEMQRELEKLTHQLRRPGE